MDVPAPTSGAGIRLKIVFWRLRDRACRGLAASCSNYAQRTSVFTVLDRHGQKYAASMPRLAEISRYGSGILGSKIRYEGHGRRTARAKRGKVLKNVLERPWEDRVREYHRSAKRKHVHSPTYERSPEARLLELCLAVAETTM